MAMGKGGIKAEIVEDSVSPRGIRLTTMQLRFPRFILPEFNTHRQFCLDGDCELEFDLPYGQKEDHRRVYTMPIREFVAKWSTGSRPHKVPAFVDRETSHIMEDRRYTAKELSDLLGYKTPSNLRTECRKGNILVENPDKKRNEDHIILGRNFLEWYETKGVRSFSLREKLANMQIRQVNEDTGMVQTSKVKDCWFSGYKSVFEVVAGDYSVSGSKDHRVLTVEGWKTIGDLTPGQDYIIAKKFGKMEEDRLNHNRLKNFSGRWTQTFNRGVKPVKLDEQDYMCFDCGTDISYESCDIHHIEPVNKRPDLAFEEGNVVAICEQCHTERHRQQGWQGGTYLHGVPIIVEDVVYVGDKDTYDLEIEGEYPNFLANGVVVHNSRNAASSRAIPAYRMIEQIRSRPAHPIHWGKNQKGMQASEEVTSMPDPMRPYDQVTMHPVDHWMVAAGEAANFARDFNWVGLHKQVVNRLLEPFQFANVVVTATEWDNFFRLRYHEDAQPEIYELARLMWEVMEAGSPKVLKPGEWHLPYVAEEELDLGTAIKCSVARSARVSYKNHDQSDPDVEKDVKLHDFLVMQEPKHASPAEHQATPMWDPYNHVAGKNGDFADTEISDGATHFGLDGHVWSGNFRGWDQYRQLL